MPYNKSLQLFAKIRNSSYYKLLLCGFLTIIAIYAHHFFPIKKLLLVPVPGATGYIYVFPTSENGSDVAWTDYEGLAWRCDIKADGEGHTCGFHLPINGGQGSKGIDLSGYDTVHVSISYRGNDTRLRFYMRNYEEGFSDVDRIETAKFNNVYIPVEYVNELLTIQMKEFSVADWWISAYEVPRKRSQPNFDHVIAFGIDLNWPAPVGTHDLQLKKLEFTGLWISAERWYFSILMFWVFVLLVIGVLRFLAMRHEALRERDRAERLRTENQQLEEQSNKYKELSMVDQLTGLLNRHGISEYINDNYREDNARQVALAVIDIDHFKQINDSLGHSGGDEVLRKIAHIIKSNIRQTDRAARWGGEEFIVIAENTGLADIYALAEKLREQIRNTHFEQFPSLVVTASMGVGVQVCRGDFPHLFRRVDTALYQAKAAGRNCTVTAEAGADED